MKKSILILIELVILFIINSMLTTEALSMISAKNDVQVGAGVAFLVALLYADIWILEFIFRQIKRQI